MNDDKRFILAIALSVAILIGFQFYHVKPQVDPHQVMEQAKQAAAEAKSRQEASTNGIVAKSVDVLRPRDEVLKENPRVAIETPELIGSVNLKGGVIDDLRLVKYREGLDEGSQDITLLSPVGSAAPYKAYHAEFGWLPDGQLTVPNADTLWVANGDKLSPQHPLTLTWNNGAGLAFERIITVDDHYMFSVTDRVRNGSPASVVLYPFALVTRQGLPVEPGKSSSVIHEGPIGVVGGTLEEYKYDKLAKIKKVTAESSGGWLGITDKYWLVALVPPQAEGITTDFSYTGSEKYDPVLGRFQADYRGASQNVAAGGNSEHTTMLFAGAKSIRQLDGYAERYNIPHFDRAIDFGWFYFLTKPFLYLLDILGNTLGSFGLAILIFTVMLKLVTLPLSLKSYHSMAKMKALQPEMKRIQEKFAEDKGRQGQEMMAFYKREKVNPAAGCVPMLIQIPIFFALYKVLYVSIELRHAPFYGWIKDMSVADPTSIFTLFGYLPWNPPALLHLGVWPILMGISMLLQQRLSPQPPDKSQAQMFMYMPIIFTFMLASMPAGLVIYWTWSNLLGIAQQWYIMRKDASKMPVASV